MESFAELSSEQYLSDLSTTEVKTGTRVFDSQINKYGTIIHVGTPDPYFPENNPDYKVTIEWESEEGKPQISVLWKSQCITGWLKKVQ